MGVSPAAIEAVEETTDSPTAGAVDGGDAISGAGADSGYGGGVIPPAPPPPLQAPAISTYVGPPVLWTPMHNCLFQNPCSKF